MNQNQVGSFPAELKLSLGCSMLLSRSRSPNVAVQEVLRMEVGLWDSKKMVALVLQCASATSNFFPALSSSSSVNVILAHTMQPNSASFLSSCKP